MTLTQSLIAIVAGLAIFPASAGERLVFVERAETDATTQIAGPKDSVGDVMTFEDPVFDAANKVRLGIDHGFCIRVVLGKSWECIWTLIIAGGQITVEGPFMESGDSTFAITGGTAKYAGAKGTAHVHPRDAEGSAYDFVYELL